MPKLSRRHLLAGVAALPLAAPVIARAQTRQLRLGVITPVGHSWNDAAIRLGEVLSQQTDGRLTVGVFPSGQLGNEPAMMQQLQSGALDMGIIQAAELGSRVDHIAAINAPYLVRSTEAVARLVRHPAVLKLFDVLPPQTGTIGLGWAITGMRAVFAVDPIDSIAGLNGMKLRINPTPVFRDFYQSLGAASTPISTPQVFDAMSNGQVDGLEADIEFSWNQRFDKVAKSILRMNAVFMPAAAVASGRVWAALPPKDQEVIAASVRTVLDEQIDSLVSEEPALIENFRATGIAMHDIPVEDTTAIVTEFDRIWLPKAPVIEQLRAIGATL
ncbi:TRAP transporter substrate-binding protein [Paracoccus sediminis]|uniref:TRAP transporter substrate-binding protein n=1 Tax=Paracoccus sediminis TaxID=1214787 RepID=A0A238VH40_9RHOB|nr:TRAP transporter substrate-binding protein [Paracoccus sediminis]TBN52082.1 TRAP transporter substrate-binding protein [Paracoccus sediminis]SNR33498.1 TRAP-type C4-dicarboxylate transport system, substrate-binding protein [Paracoccus sediminis]